MRRETYVAKSIGLAKSGKEIYVLLCCFCFVLLFYFVLESNFFVLEGNFQV